MDDNRKFSVYTIADLDKSSIKDLRIGETREINTNDYINLGEFVNVNVKRSDRLFWNYSELKDNESMIIVPEIEYYMKSGNTRLTHTDQDIFTIFHQGDEIVSSYIDSETRVYNRSINPLLAIIHNRVRERVMYGEMIGGYDRPPLARYALLESLLFIKEYYGHLNELKDVVTITRSNKRVYIITQPPTIDMVTSVMSLSSLTRGLDMKVESIDNLTVSFGRDRDSISLADKSPSEIEEQVLLKYYESKFNNGGRVTSMRNNVTLKDLCVELVDMVIGYSKENLGNVDRGISHPHMLVSVRTGRNSNLYEKPSIGIHEEIETILSRSEKEIPNLGYLYGSRYDHEGEIQTGVMSIDLSYPLCRKTKNKMSNIIALMNEVVPEYLGSDSVGTKLLISPTDRITHNRIKSSGECNDSIIVFKHPYLGYTVYEVNLSPDGDHNVILVCKNISIDRYIIYLKSYLEGI